MGKVGFMPDGINLEITYKKLCKIFFGNNNIKIGHYLENERKFQNIGGEYGYIIYINYLLLSLIILFIF